MRRLAATALVLGLLWTGRSIELPTVLVTHRAAAVTERPLNSLWPQAQDYLLSRQGPLGVAVLVPETGQIYTWNGEELFPMASVIKVPIMLTLLDRARQQERYLTDEEWELLFAMITYSDNDAATSLWDEVGGADPIQQLMLHNHLDQILPDPIGYWGDSLASPSALTELFIKTLWGDLLDLDSRAVAIDLLSQVHPSQLWGLNVISQEWENEWLLGKAGWYPNENGWEVSSTAFVGGSAGRPTYVIAVMTAEQESMEYAVETIETVARAVNAALHGPAAHPPGGEKF